MEDGPKAKRLRGHDLELQKRKACTLTKGQSKRKSGLCEKLLSLWAHGQLSAKMCQELAHLAVLDGAQGQELAHMASCGNWGQVGGNCHRDFMANWCKGNPLSPPYEVEVPVRDPKTSKVGKDIATIFLPHLLFSNLHASYPLQFEKMFGKASDVAQFWKNVEAVKDERRPGHPICLDKRTGLVKRHVVNAEYTIPLFTHADGVEFQSRDTIMVWNWGGFLSFANSLSSHLLLCAMPKSCTTESTWKPIMSYIKWSFECLHEGDHPCFGPEGEPLPKGSVFEKLAGQPLTCQGHRAVIWSIQGDHEMYSNHLGLNHWNSQFCCWECDAQQPLTKGKPCPKGKAFNILREDQQKFSCITHAQALAKGSAHALFTIAGLSTKMVRHDGLHVMFCTGVCSHLCGSILHFLCYNDGKGRQAVKPSDRLALIFSQIQQEYKKQKAPTRLTNLRLSMVTDPQKPHQSWPKLDCKAAECKHFMPAFLPVLKAMLDTSNEMHAKMVHALQSMVSLVELFDEAGMFLDKRTYARARKLAKEFFYSYAWLSEWAEEADRYLFHITVKFHTFDHLVKSSCDINPRCTWNFRSEDFVGKISTLGASVVHGVKTTRLCQKINAKYYVLLQLQLERLGFDPVDLEPDP